jgi:pyroglutamyl-peptidase
MTTVLVTGFDPFGGDTLNASWEAARRLDGGVLAGGARVVAARLPVSCRDARTTLAAAIQRHDPAVVIAVGQAASRAALSLERIAINLDDYRVPDNTGAMPVDQPIVAGGPAAYWSSLPLRATLDAVRAAAIPCAFSTTAGTYLRNHVFYVLMDQLAREGGRRLGGFVHVPLTPAQNVAGEKASLASDTVAEALALAAGCALQRLATAVHAEA